MTGKKVKKVSVVGLGYIGLPTAAVLANEGFEVLGMDINKSIVSMVNNGKVQIVEPNLDKYVRSAVSNGSLKAFTSVQIADVYMICVPTPLYICDGIPTPNLDYVKNAVEKISPLIKKGDVIILESTSPVGTTDLIKKLLLEKNVVLDNVYIAYCPERVLPGSIINELVHNPRIIGGINKKSTLVVADFYRKFVKGKILKTEARIAEMCKLTENSFRDVNIAFANELSIICDANDVNVWELIKLANYHPRVNILQPGAGVGGHCIAVDPWFIVKADQVNSKIIKQARLTNDSKPNWVIEKVCQRAKQIKKTIPKIACLGLAFKPDVDDLRESPSVFIAKSLNELNYKVVCVEPNIETHADFELVSLEVALKDSDVIIVLVGHKKFKKKSTIEQLRNAKALDFCGILA